jgi:hypothetical protein
VLLSENATANEPKPEDLEEGYADYRLEKRREQGFFNNNYEADRVALLL